MGWYGYECGGGVFDAPQIDRERDLAVSRGPHVCGPYKQTGRLAAMNVVAPLDKGG